MNKYILSPAAKKSLRQIGNYTLKNYGTEQKKRYLRILRDTMQKAANAPEANGKARPEIKTGYYSILSGKHTIYYRIKPEHIDIIDVLHQRMEPTNHLF